MSQDVFVSNGLLVPLRIFVELIHGQRAEELDVQMKRILDGLLEKCGQDDNVEAEYGFTRDCFEIVMNRVIQPYFEGWDEAHVNEQAAKDWNAADAFVRCLHGFVDLKQDLNFEAAETARWILNLILKATFGKNAVPTLKDIIVFDSPSEHGDPWLMGGLMRSMEGPLSGMSFDELEMEVYQKHLLR